MDMNQIFKIKQAWDTFRANHPKFPGFLSAVKRSGIEEGSVIAISITDPSGKVVETNIKVTRSDLELFESLKQMTP